MTFLLFSTRFLLPDPQAPFVTATFQRLLDMTVDEMRCRPYSTMKDVVKQCEEILDTVLDFNTYSETIYKQRFQVCSRSRAHRFHCVSV